MIAVTQYSTALLLTVIIYFLFKNYISENNNSKLKIIIIILILFFIFKSQIADFFTMLSAYFKEKSLGQFADRMNAISSILRGEEASGSTGGKMELYGESWIAFIKSPIFWRLKYEVYRLGGHSELLDLLGGSGMLGFACFVGLIKIHYSNIVMNGSKEWKLCCIISLIAFLSFICIDTAFSSANVGGSLFFGSLLFVNSGEKNLIE